MSSKTQELSEKLSDIDDFRLDISHRFIVFQVKSEIISLSVKHVGEVVDLEEVRVIPKLSRKYKGICNLRGEILPVLDLSYILFGESSEKMKEDNKIVEETEVTKKEVTDNKEKTNKDDNKDDSETLIVGHNYQKVVFINGEDETFGLLVDEIDDIIEIPEDAFEQVPDIVKTGVPLKYIKNIAQIGDKTIIILNFLKLMKKNFSLYDGYLKDEDIDDDSDDFSEVFEGDSEDTLDISIEDEIEEKVMNNKQNIVDKKISKVRLELNEDQLSAFREIASISTGKIAEALSNLMEPSTKIEIDIQDVGLEDLSDFREKHARKEDLYVAIRSPLTRDFHGVVYLMISVEGLCKLLKKVEIVEDFPDEFEDLNDLDADSVSAINEIGNMIISHYCSGLSNFLKLKMYHESPEVAIAEFTALIDNELVNLMTKSDRGIFSETSIKIDNEDIDGEIVFIPYYESIEQFIEFFEVDRIIELLEQESKQNKITTKTKKTTKKGKKTTKSKKSKKSTKSKTQKSTAKNRKAKQEEHSEEIMEMVVSQKDFNIDQSILDELNITVSNLDSFRELGNMGAGNAGNSLSEILKEKVFLEIPPANVLNIQELTDSFRDKDRKRVGYMCMSTGFLEGNAFLMYTPEDLKNLLNMVFDKGFKKTIKKTTDLSPMEKKGVIKLLHMLLDGYFKALATFLKIPFEPPKYKFFVQSPKMLFGKIAASLPNKNVRGVIIETNLQVDLDIPMRGQFILLLSAEVFPRILEKMEAVWG